MKLADRLKFTANGTSAAAISVGAAVTACRTLAQAISDGALAVGDTNVPFTVTDGAAWEDSLFTVTSTTQLTRTSVLASSAGGTTAATFSGPLTVFNAVPGAILSRVSFDSDVPFSQAVPLTQPGTAWMPQQTVSGALNFTPAANAVKGAYAYVRLVADGVNTPTWTGFTEEIGSAGYDNRNGIVNRIQFAYDGSDYWVAVSQALNAVAVAAAASALTLTLSSASVVPGSPVTVTVGTDSPLTGSQTESVTLTAPVAGTWSANPVALNASTATAATTFTPSATGSGNVTAAASGSPTLTGASAVLTVTAAATSSNVRLSQLSHVTESGTGPYTYTADNATYTSGTPGPGGVATTSFQNGVDGSIAATANNLTSTSEVIVGIANSATLLAYNNLPFALYGAYGLGIYKQITSGTIGAASTSVTPQSGDIMRLRRAGSSLIAEVARAASPTAFTTIYTWSGVSTAALYINVMASNGSNAANLTGVGLA